jgi:hypothetical protein
MWTFQHCYSFLGQNTLLKVWYGKAHHKNEKSTYTEDSFAFFDKGSARNIVKPEARILD